MARRSPSTALSPRWWLSQGNAPQTIEGWLIYRDRERQKLEYRKRAGEEVEDAIIPVGMTSILPAAPTGLWIRGFWSGVLGNRYGVEVAFTDRSGENHWIRHATGKLEDLPEDPITYYLGAGPHDLQIPERLPELFVYERREHLAGRGERCPLI